MRCNLVAGHGALAVALTVTACGGGSSGTSGSPSAPTPTSNATTISIAGERGAQSFSPNPASAGGRMVMWRNDDGVTHHIVANDGSSFDTGDIAPGAISAMVQMPQFGLNYHCSIHPTTMFGAIGGGGGEAPPACDSYCDD